MTGNSGVFALKVASRDSNSFSVTGMVFRMTLPSALTVIDWVFFLSRAVRDWPGAGRP